MPDLSERDPAAHLHPAFREEFPTWRELRAFVESRATSPAFDTQRALRQLLSVDLAQRLAGSADYGWIVRGSLALPGRPPPGLLLPDHLREARHGSQIDPLYALARPLNDIDLCARHIPDAPAAERATALAGVIRDVVDTRPVPQLDHGIGLGGLVHYSTDDLRTLRDGRAVAETVAQPIDPGRVSELVPVDDPVTLHIDLSPPGAATFGGPPERAHRSTLALDLPGFDEYRPDLYPTANQLSDKLCTISVPYGNLEPPPDFHRYKDPFDVQYLIDTCVIDAGQLRPAIAANERLARAGRQGLPSPFQPYGLRPGPGEPAVPWRERYDRLRRENPALAGHRDFDDGMARICGFVDELNAGDDDRRWLPAHRWLPREQALLIASRDRLKHAEQRLAAEAQNRTDDRPPTAEATNRWQRSDLPAPGHDGPSLSR